MKTLIKYHAHLYFKSKRFALPFLTWNITLLISLFGQGSYVLNNGVMLTSILYICMAAASYSYMDIEKNEKTADWVMIFHAESMERYWWSKNLFLCLMAFLMSLLGGIAVLAKSLKERESFSLLWVAIFFLCGLSGVAQGVILHPRIVRDRFLSVIALLAIILLTLLRCDKEAIEV